jgi:hypothetical protein
MSDQATPLKRLLLWLSGAPAEPEMAVSPATQPANQDVAATPTPEPAADISEPATPVETAPLADSQVANGEPAGTTEPLRPTDRDEQPEGTTMTNEPINDASAYGVTIVPADAPEGATYWRAMRVHHLTPDENQGRHHIFLDALDETGSRVSGAQARVNWPGGEQTITVDKPLGEPGSNFPMWKWQICTVEMLGLPSDRVENLHTGHPDEPPGQGNTLFHHSFEVVFQRAVSSAGQPPMPPPPTPPGDKLLERYVLFGPPASSRTAVYLELTRSYLLAQQPTFGYSVDEASHAHHVVIVGELQDISQESEDALRQAGCQVQRVQGTPGQIAAAFQALHNS